SDTSSSDSSSSSSAPTGQATGQAPITEHSAPEQVITAIKELPFMADIDVEACFKDVDGSILGQLLTPDNLIELTPTLPRRNAVLLAAKIRGWFADRGPRSKGTKRRRQEASPATTGNKRKPTGHEQLREAINNLLDSDDKVNDTNLDEKVAKALVDFKEGFGTLSGDLLPPREVIKELIKAKEAGKPKGSAGALPNSHYVPYLELKRFSPTCMASYSSSNADSSPAMVILRTACMAVSYAVAGLWTPADGFNYIINGITKVAAQDGWGTALKYDEAVRTTWATRSIFDDSFDIHIVVRHVDLECLIMVRGASDKGGRSGNSGVCFAFDKGGPAACKRKNCPYTHRCTICRSFKHGSEQHKKFTNDTGNKQKQQQSGDA
ncbi:hypothetical protein FOZ62_011220, partial [Perkinsus olseni]